jgi:nitric oxide reductase activation protein
MAAAGATGDDALRAAIRVVALIADPRPAARVRTGTAIDALPGPGVPDGPPGGPSSTDRRAGEERRDGDGRRGPQGSGDGADGDVDGDAASTAHGAGSVAASPSRALPAGARSPRTRPALPAAPRWGTPRLPAGGVLHDEWDYVGQRYLRAWCRVHEQRLRGTATDFGDAVRRRHPELARTLRERFARMRPAGRTRVRGVDDGEELDLDALVAAVVDRRAGHASDAGLHVRREPRRRDVAAAFLVDTSASTAVALPDADTVTGPAPAPPPQDTGALLYGLYDDLPEPPRGPRRRVIDVAKDALALMADALAPLGDAIALYGFSGDGRDDVEFVVAKEFDDPLSPSAWAALAAMEPRGSTRMGAAVRHASAKLARQPAARRLLVVVSDGYPQDTDYGPDRGDEEYGIQDTARALQEAERAGVSTFCVTIDPAGHDYLRRMCPPRRYLVIDDVPALPAELARVYEEWAAAR